MSDRESLLEVRRGPGARLHARLEFARPELACLELTRPELACLKGLGSEACRKGAQDFELNFGKPSHATLVIYHGVGGRCGCGAFALMADLVSELQGCATHPFEPRADLDGVIKSCRFPVVDFDPCCCEVDALGGVEGVALIVFFEPTDSRDFEITDVVGVMDDAHRVGVKERDAVVDCRDHRAFGDFYRSMKQS